MTGHNETWNLFSNMIKCMDKSASQKCLLLLVLSEIANFTYNICIDICFHVTHLLTYVKAWSTKYGYPISSGASFYM